MYLLTNILNNFVVYAATGDYGIDTSFKPILTGVIGISTALAVLSLAICVLRYMTSDDGSGIAAAKKDAITVILSWTLLNSVGVIIYAALSLISGIQV